MRSEGERVQAANSVSYRWKEESGFGLHSPARRPHVIGATNRRVMGSNEAYATRGSCSDDLPVLPRLPLQTCRRHYPGGIVRDEVVQLPLDGGLP